MNLPGGLWHEGRRQREFAFKPLTGALELALAEASLETASMPEVVTQALAAALGHLNDLEATPALIDALSVGDRQFLVQQLAGWLEMEVIRGESGAPTIMFHGNAADFIAAEGIATVQVSLTHARDYAAANAVAVRQVG